MGTVNGNCDVVRANGDCLDGIALSSCGSQQIVLETTPERVMYRNVTRLISIMAVFVGLAAFFVMKFQYYMTVGGTTTVVELTMFDLLVKNTLSVHTIFIALILVTTVLTAMSPRWGLVAALSWFLLWVAVMYQGFTFTENNVKFVYEFEFMKYKLFPVVEALIFSLLIFVVSFFGCLCMGLSVKRHWTFKGADSNTTYIMSTDAGTKYAYGGMIFNVDSNWNKIWIKNQVRILRS